MRVFNHIFEWRDSVNPDISLIPKQAKTSTRKAKPPFFLSNSPKKPDDKERYRVIKAA
jgi:hypothetical protein